MLRVFRLLMFITFSLHYCHGDRPALYIPEEKTAALKTELEACAQDVNGELSDLLEQMYNWDIKSEETIKRFLKCFFGKYQGKDTKTVTKSILDMIGDCDEKNKIGNVFDECSKKRVGSTKADRIFSFIECYNKNTPVLLKIKL